MHHVSTRRMAMLAAFLLALSLGGCGGGGGGSSDAAGGGDDGGGTQPPKPPQSFLIVDQVPLTLRSFIVDPTAPVLQPLHGAVTSSATPQAWRGTKLLIPAEADGAPPALYLVDENDPGTRVRMNDVIHTAFRASTISPDGNYVAYISGTDVYLVLVSNPGVATRMNPPLGGGRVIDVRFGPQSDRLVYLAIDGSASNPVELYTVVLTQPGNVRKLNSTLPLNGDVDDFDISPDGAMVFYKADQDTLGVQEAYGVSISSPGVSVKYSQNMVAGGTVGLGPWISNDGQYVVYTADAAVDGQRELWRVPVGSPGVAARVHPTFADSSRQIRNLGAQIPGTTRVLYQCDADVAGQFELYMADLASPGAHVNLNASLAPGGQVDRFVPNHAGTHVLYSGEGDTAGVNELYLVDLTTPGIATKLSHAMPPGSTGVSGFIGFSLDGAYVTYTSALGDPALRNAYRAPVATPGMGQIKVVDLAMDESAFTHIATPVDASLRLTNFDNP